MDVEQTLTLQFPCRARATELSCYHCSFLAVASECCTILRAAGCIMSEIFAILKTFETLLILITTMTPTQSSGGQNTNVPKVETMLHVLDS